MNSNKKIKHKLAKKMNQTKTEKHRQGKQQVCGQKRKRNSPSHAQKDTSSYVFLG
jgi:hypothetical protein